MDENPIEKTSISRTEAAEILGVSERSIFRYMQRGSLRRVVQQGRCEVARTDVSRLQAGRALEARLAEVELDELEQKLAKAIDIMDKLGDSLGLGPEDLVRVYEAAEFFADVGCPPAHARSWSEILLKLSRQDLEALATAMDVTDPWRPFLQSALNQELPDDEPELEMLMIAARNQILLLSTEAIERDVGKVTVHGWC